MQAAGAGTPLGLVGLGFQVTPALGKGKAQSDSLAFQSDQATKAARAGRVAADQTDAFLRDELSTTVSHISAIRASAGLKDSPTSDAIVANESEVSDNQRRIKVGNLKAQADDDEKSAAFLRKSARSALNMSYLSAAGVGLEGLSGRRRERA
jgi:hypothetical protein